MIVMDLETSGLYPERNGIWQIGALEFENPSNYFIDECRIDDEEYVEREALEVTGKTEEELRDENMQSQRELLEKFFAWCESVKIKNCICQNPQFDLGFLGAKARKYGLKFPLPHRTFDMHSIGALRYFEIHEKLLIRDDKSDMGLGNILKMCGIEDKRKKMEKGVVVQEGNPHNALEDAKLTAECFSRIFYGKHLLNEFSQYKIPKYAEIKK